MYDYMSLWDYDYDYDYDYDRITVGLDAIDVYFSINWHDIKPSNTATSSNCLYEEQAFTAFLVCMTGLQENMRH